MSTEFKTSDIYLFQPVPIPTITRPLMATYLTLFRPMIVKSHNLAIDDPKAPMFLSHLTGEGTNKRTPRCFIIFKTHSILSLQRSTL
jgi:hypothetical protein